MKIIHTADIHLDSPLTGVADSALRRTELLRAFANMSAYADNSGVEAIIVAGDLFDDKYVSTGTLSAVAEIINGSKCRWFMLKGNHGSDAPYKALEKLCPKVQMFGVDWTTYNVGNVSICGRELGVDDAKYWQELSLDSSRYNILVLHGDVDDPAYGLIDKKVIASSAVNYVALGHRHAFCQHKFGRVVGCYSGVLECRGFDEATDTGFLVVDTQADTVKFVPQHLRCVETRKIDVSAVTSDLALEKLLLNAVADVSSRNYLNLEFVGTLAKDVRLEAVANEVLQGKFFALRIKDSTTVPYDLQKLAEEVSLRGEFVKLALQLTDAEERDAVLNLGLRALDGEVSD